MGHYEEKLQDDLEVIRTELSAVSDKVAEALERAVRAVLTHDSELAAEVMLGDLPINRSIRSIDALCHAFVARHLPSAGHLRFVSSVLRLTIGVERVGDYAVTLCREAVQLSARPPEVLARDIELTGEQATSMFRQAMAAFLEGNAELARGTKAMSEPIDKTGIRVFQDLVRAAEKERSSVVDLFALLVILNRIGRVSSQAKNICEQTLFAVSGEVKKPKVYKVLFLDQKDNALTQLAKAYCSRAFPESATYESAGWGAADQLEPRTRMFLDSKGFGIGELAPQALTSIEDSLGGFDVIVALQPQAREQLRELPFHTVLAEWDLGERPDDFDQDRAEALLDGAYKNLKVRARDLMETLRGPDAD